MRGKVRFSRVKKKSDHAFLTFLTFLIVKRGIKEGKIFWDKSGCKLVGGLSEDHVMHRLPSADSVSGSG